MTTTTQSPIVLGEGWDPKARAVPGSWWDRDDKTYKFNPSDATPRTAAVALKLYPELQYSYPELVAEREKLVQDVRPFDNATPHGKPIEAPTVRERLQVYGHDLYDFQAIDLGYMAAILEEHGLDAGDAGAVRELLGGHEEAAFYHNAVFYHNKIQAAVHFAFRALPTVTAQAVAIRAGEKAPMDAVF